MIQEMGVDQFLSWTKDLSINFLFPNYDEGRVLTGFDEPDEIVRSLANIYDGALIILKLDADGALVFDGETSTQIPPATNNLVDATGAGDSFAGAFLAHYLNSNSAVDAAKFATKVAAWVIEHLGARPANDTRLQQIINSR
jgi:ribokinase